MAFKIFIDGKEGTTGLKIFERLSDRADLDILLIDEARRKDADRRKKLINASDLTFLCLPDEAAVQAVLLAENSRTKIIDASTAHRVSPGWAYGFPELSAGHRRAIETSARIANPGCYPTGFLSLVYPLRALGLLPADYPVVCHAVSGYSGGGKKMIAAYENPDRPAEYDGPRQYALAQSHKHQREMQAIAGLDSPPIFNPAVSDFFCGMTVSVPLYARLLAKNPGARDIHELLCGYYEGRRFVRVMPFGGQGVLADGFLSSNALCGTNDLHIYVCGNDERILLAACLDNLGKGASGAAVQCMNLALGLDEAAGL
jgi:N-acetyl-gamma-glutamyl-phosphate reductase